MGTPQIAEDDAGRMLVFRGWYRSLGTTADKEILVSNKPGTSGLPTTPGVYKAKYVEYRNLDLKYSDMSSIYLHGEIDMSYYYVQESTNNSILGVKYVNAEHSIVRASVPVNTNFAISEIGLENSFLFLDDDLIELSESYKITGITLSGSLPRGTNTTTKIDTYLLSTNLNEDPDTKMKFGKAGLSHSNI